MIDNKEKELAKLNKELLKEEVYMDISKAKAIQEKIEKITKEIEIKTKEWEDLANKL